MSASWSLQTEQTVIRLLMKKWKAWESETESLEYKFTNVVTVTDWSFFFFTLVANSPPHAGYTNDSAGQMGEEPTRDEVYILTSTHKDGKLVN
uniref:Uncharacterized protein n=1 Tax=Quercus lobata TaxID=97700 RepID=A0A7N2L9M8_QUELO